jgi:NAD(P)-dependent dehydrogenase (short-subunit alcohol dehydrogenase family)
MNGIILITGASGGIGRATALKAAAKGYSVCVHFHTNKSSAEDIVNEIQRNGGSAFAAGADISKEDEVKKLFANIDSKPVPLTALVNNAGTLEKQMPFMDMDVARWTRIFAANVMGTFLCAREAAVRMAHSRGGQGGSIVNVSSLGAVFGSPNEFVDYAASKGAVDTFTVGFAKEVAADGIRVNAVRPGVTHTGIHVLAGEPDRIDRVKAVIPMKRGGQPGEIADSILWLLSDEASYVTGAILNVSGGR